MSSHCYGLAPWTMRESESRNEPYEMTPFFPSPSLAVGYFVACVLLAATPGADMALFLSRTLSGGRRFGFAAQAGANVGLVVHTFAAALGLSALLAASAGAYQAVKIAGALYLLWLAYGAIRRGTALKLGAGSAAGGLRGAFWTGLLINLTNPKIVLFFVTFLPQFIDAGDVHASAKLFALGFGFIAITTLVNAVVILIAARFVAAANARPHALRLFDYGFAALMSAFAARLVWSEAR
jgi:threonine/homoserine/homoserine lactone efflux protein